MPKLLILDEPSCNFDIKTTDNLYTILQQLRDDFAISTIMSSHDLHLVMKNADKVVCVNHGIHCIGTPNDMQKTDIYKEFAAHHLGVYLHS